MAKVRAATEKDVPRILELYRQLDIDPATHRSPSPDDCRRVLAEMQKIPGYQLLVAEEAGEVVGTLVLAVLPGFAHGTSPFAVVEYVVVYEKYRSRGIGHTLMEYAISQAAKAGCYKIMLTSDKRRRRAHKFYRSLGFASSAQGFRRYF